MRPISPPSSKNKIAFCTCIRFSAWSKTTDCSESITASVTSSLRCAGRQCRKIACGDGTGHQLFVYLIGRENLARSRLRAPAHAGPGVGVDGVRSGDCFADHSSLRWLRQSFSRWRKASAESAPSARSLWEWPRGSAIPDCAREQQRMRDVVPIAHIGQRDFFRSPKRSCKVK